MSLENYLLKSYLPYQEIQSDFHHEQVLQLYNRAKEIGYTGYFAFVRNNLPDILKYISLSSSQRQQKKWVNHPDNLLIRFAALQISGATVDLLDGLVPISDIVNNGSYRDFHSISARALAPILLNHPLLKFPFDGFDNPFR